MVTLPATQGWGGWLRPAFSHRDGGVALLPSPRPGWLDVELPRSFALLYRFRKSFRRAIPLDRPYSWSVRGERAQRRVAIFAHEEDRRAVYERQRGREAIADAEWSGIVRPLALPAPGVFA